MTPKEKLNRITNPQTVKDFGLTISSKELKTFPEGRALAEKIESHASLRGESKELFAQLAEKKNELISQCINEALELK